MMQFRNPDSKGPLLLVAFNADGSVEFITEDPYYSTLLEPSDVKLLAANLARHVAEHESKCDR